MYEITIDPGTVNEEKLDVLEMIQDGDSITLKVRNKDWKDVVGNNGTT